MGCMIMWLANEGFKTSIYHIKKGESDSAAFEAYLYEKSMGIWISYFFKLFLQFCNNSSFGCHLQENRVSITACTVLSHLLLFMVMFWSQCHGIRLSGNSAAFKEFIISPHIAEQNLSCYLKLQLTSQRLYRAAFLRREFCD